MNNRLDDFTLHVGDVRDVLATLAAGSVDCVITSPPYWGLRDYGTGAWSGGDAGCDHTRNHREQREFVNSQGTVGQGCKSWTEREQSVYGQTCGKCGAVRVDRQLGLEASLDEFLANMVAVFDEIWRVLADYGTVWCNLGDSYVSGQGGRQSAAGELPSTSRFDRPDPHSRPDLPNPPSGWAERAVTRRTYPGRDSGMKPKDLCGVPWRVAFALQDDGWYLRSDIIWSKPNPMPEAVTDRPTKAHEYVFLLSKRPRYWFDQDAVREPHTGPPIEHFGRAVGKNGRRGDASGITQARGNGQLREYNPAGRNIRSVWDIATQAYPDAHFATYPEELVRRCLLAGCPRHVCRQCGKPRERMVELTEEYRTLLASGKAWRTDEGKPDAYTNRQPKDHPGQVPAKNVTVGWTDCGHGDYRAGVVLDPFLGSGTTALVALRHDRACVGVELNPEYAALARERVRWWHRKPEPAPAQIDGQLAFEVT